MSAGSESVLYPTLAGLIAGAIGLVVVLGMLRTRVISRYPGGSGRYVLALVVQASAFIIPVPWVALSLFPMGPYGAPILAKAPHGTHILAGLLVGFLLVLALRALPGTGPLLNDLVRARLETALERLPPYSIAEAPPTSEQA